MAFRTRPPQDVDVLAVLVLGRPIKKFNMSSSDVLVPVLVLLPDVPQDGGDEDRPVLRSPVSNVISPFRAEMKIVVTASYDNFYKNYFSRNQDHEFKTRNGKSSETQIKFQNPNK